MNTKHESGRGAWNPRIILIALYGAGVAAMALWGAIGHLAQRRVLATARPAGAQARALLRGLAGPRSGRVRLLESEHVAQPCAFGLRQAVIVLPHRFRINQSLREMRWVLAHEWSHIERGDLRSWWLCTLLGWLHFYQPLYWLLKRRLYVCQDYLADAAAARQGEVSEDYALFLTARAWTAAALAPGLGLGGRLSDLHRRILMLVDGTLAIESKAPRAWNAVAGAVMVLLVAALAALLPAPPRAVAQEKAPAKKAAPNRLSYNDGRDDGKRSLGGSGELISFTLPSDSDKVAGIRIHGSRYGSPQPPKENFMIYFLNQDLSETVATESAPYSRFQRGDQKWVEIKFKKPIEVPKEFWVCLDFRAAQTKGVYVSTDSSTDGSHSKMGLPGGDASQANIEGDWMIEVVLAK